MSAELGSFRIRKLTFAGSGVGDASVEFDRGLSIVYGGSNAGKSFTLNALDFMFGADRLRLPKQGQEYEIAYLWLDTPEGKKVTLQRATKGGSLTLFEGHLSPTTAAVTSGTILAATQKGRKGKNNKNKSLSEYLLQQIGINEAVLAKNEAGQKIQFSIRLLSHYLFVGEDEIIGQRSPIQIPEQRMSSLDKSLFRFLLTGKDDKSVIEVPNSDNLAASRDGKVELLTELMAALQLEAPAPSEEVLEFQLKIAEISVQTVHEKVKENQENLDKLAFKRRQVLDIKADEETTAAELRLMLSRFLELKKIYESDIARLDALDEGAVLLEKFSMASCSLCGADPSHQKHQHTRVDFDLQRAAALAEIRKISIDLADLSLTIEPLAQDIAKATDFSAFLGELITDINLEISNLRPKEQELRLKYEQANGQKLDISNKLMLVRQNSSYEMRIKDLQQIKIGRQRAEGLALTLDTATAHSFSMTVKAVLAAWQYPDMGDVSFDKKSQDIVVNGRERVDNGKGIRAILHSAFKVAVLIYCRVNSLPHPGFVVLDSPLLTYRGPLQFKKHGELSDDEIEFKKTALNEHFYEHLASISSLGQFIVLENQDPPQTIRGKAKITMFSGEKGGGRQGFFPALN